MWVVAVEVGSETELCVVQTSGEDRGAALWDPEWGVFWAVWIDRHMHLSSLLVLRFLLVPLDRGSEPLVT